MLAENIRKLRKEKGLTQTELGEKLVFAIAQLPDTSPRGVVSRNQHLRKNYANRKTFLLTLLRYV